MVLITGASGFVGSALCRALHGVHQIRGVVRGIMDGNYPGGIEFVTGNLTADFQWAEALKGINQIIHCAARVHVMNESSPDPLAEFRLINVDGTMRLATQAAAAGVRRFIYMSSIKVNGEFTQLDYPFTPDQKPAPRDPYGISKNEAEIELRKLSDQTGMEVVIIRPPLVYGPGVKANFLSMMNWLQRGIPLPLGGITQNRRSFVFIDNLIDLVAICLNHPAAANQTFLVSDGQDESTTGLLERMAFSLGKPSKLIAVPEYLIKFGANLVSRPGIYDRLCGSLQVDIKKTKDLLSWSPQVSMDRGMHETAAHFLKLQS